MINECHDSDTANEALRNREPITATLTNRAVSCDEKVNTEGNKLEYIRVKLIGVMGSCCLTNIFEEITQHGTFQKI